MVAAVVADGPPAVLARRWYSYNDAYEAVWVVPQETLAVVRVAAAAVIAEIVAVASRTVDEVAVMKNVSFDSVRQVLLLSHVVEHRFVDHLVELRAQNHSLQLASVR